VGVIKARITTSFEAENIYDLDLDDPVRNVVLDAKSEYGSSAQKATYRMFVEQFTLVPNTSGTINLSNGTYNFGVLTPMLDGFGIVQGFGVVHALQIRGAVSNARADLLEIKAAAVNPWTDLLDQFAVNSLLRLRAHTVFLLTTGTTGNSYEASAVSQSFILSAPATNTANYTFDIALIGWEF